MGEEESARDAEADGKKLSEARARMRGRPAGPPGGAPPGARGRGVTLAVVFRRCCWRIRCRWAVARCADDCPQRDRRRWMPTDHRKGAES